MSAEAVSVTLDDRGPYALVKLRVSNQGARAETAWSYTVEGRYSDGATRSTSTNTDHVTSFLQPNESLSEFAILPLGTRGEMPAGIEITIRLVAMDDLSTLGAAAEVEQLKVMRSGLEAGMAKVVASIEAACNAQDTGKALQDLAAREPRDNMMLKQLVPLYDRRGVDGVREILTAYKAYRDLLRYHS